VLSAIVVGAASRWVSGRSVEREMRGSFEAIRQTLQPARFPLTAPVLSTLADLTGTELAIYDNAGAELRGTVAAAPRQLLPPTAGAGSHADGFRGNVVPGYLVRQFPRQGPRIDGVAHVLVMYDTEALQRARRSAALLPLATGLFSTLLLGGVALVISRHMITRIELLRENVQRVAGGDFAPGPLVGGDDELGQLGEAIRKMSRDLHALWRTVQQQERQKSMHQLAAGLAHQLRNSLTGARMALDLHTDHYLPREGVSSGDAEKSAAGLGVARREIQRTQDYVQRILDLAQQPSGEGQPAVVADALRPIRESLEMIARHHRVALRWELPEPLGRCRVADGASLAMAVENLILNALEAGGETVCLEVRRAGAQLEFCVRDNGPGLSPVSSPGDPDGGGAVSTERIRPARGEFDSEVWFEPFMTSKPEGLGLGLSLVRRAAVLLGGEVRHERRDGWTCFFLRAGIMDAKAPSMSSQAGD
jgi:hypothetical protein